MRTSVNSSVSKTEREEEAATTNGTHHTVMCFIPVVHGERA
jgi:hypothetical protein